MEALKIFDIEELLKRQELLDKKFDEKQTIRKRELDLIRLAYHTELGEFLQEVKSDWNYWKNSTKEIDKQRALEELSDMLHFSLSYVNNDYIDSRIRNKDVRFIQHRWPFRNYIDCCRVFGSDRRRIFENSSSSMVEKYGRKN